MSAAEVRKRLAAIGKPARAEVSRRYFKTGPGQYAEGDKFLGVSVPDLRALTRDYRDLSLREITTLLKSEWHEERLFALLIMVWQYPRGDEARRNALYATYIKHTEYINNWDLVDLSAEHIVGPHLKPAKRSVLRTLARSPDLWERRIAMLATFHYIRLNEFDDALAIAAMLRDDEEDLIHKAVGWMLREIGNRDRAAEEAFLRTHARSMPRTMLRYAIEKFPPPLRAKYMKA